TSTLAQSALRAQSCSFICAIINAAFAPCWELLRCAQGNENSSTSTITNGGLHERLRFLLSRVPDSRFWARARVVKWQTRTFEGRMPQGVGVQVPPRAFSSVYCVPSRNI